MELRGPFDGFVEKAVRASTTCLIMADHNRYSIDARAAGRMVLVRSHAERIVVLFNDEMVADHPRSFRRDQTIYDPWHYLPVLLKKLAQWGAPFKNWDLPPGLGQVRAKLTQHADGDRQFVKVLGAVPEHGLAAVEAALRRGARGRSCRRRRHPDHPGPATPTGPATQHHHARCTAPEDRAHGRLWPLRQHKVGSPMERHEILDAMSELKLYGMRASFDEIAGKGLTRRDEFLSSPA